MIAGRDAVEAAGRVGDHPGEHVEAAGRAFRIGGGADVGREREAFEQRHDVDAAGLEHGAVAERDLVQLQFIDALGDRRVRARQEARPHPIGDLAETQIDARRLDLVFVRLGGGDDRARLEEGVDHAVGQNALVLGAQVQRHVQPRAKRSLPRNRNRLCRLATSLPKSGSPTSVGVGLGRGTGGATGSAGAIGADLSGPLPDPPPARGGGRTSAQINGALNVGV